MDHNILIIIAVSGILFISPLISQLIKVPTIPIEIVLGSLISHYVFINSSHIFDLVAELGFLYLMFLAGLEVDLKKLLKISPQILKRSLLYIALLYVLSLVAALYLGLSHIFIVILPLISIGLLAVLKKEYGNEPWIDLAITAGLIGEIVSIILLTTVSAGLEFGVGYEFYKSLLLLALVFVLMIVIYKLFHNAIWWYPQIKTLLMPKDDMQNQDIRLSMAIFFLMIAIMLYLHLEVAFGAFIAGTFIATFFEHNKALPHKLEQFGFGFLVPIFFISIGASFNLESIFEDNLVFTAFQITIAMILIRFFAALVFIKDLKFKSTLLLSLSHSMPLTLLIAVATLAFDNNSIDRFYYYAFILASILEVLIGMISIRIVHQKLK
ncbi:MAG: cation:proton antiporter [Campylobacterota bacterium]|nr:cation:proton antiporter [Campylobacterota bacterium]